MDTPIATDVRQTSAALRVFTLGPAGGSPVVLVNAYGLPFELMRPLAETLAGEGYRVATWESRGVPNLEPDFKPEECGVGSHVQDLHEVMSLSSWQRADVVGWCSGAQVALRFASTAPAAVRKLVLVNGFYSLWTAGLMSDFQEKLYRFVPSCVRSPASAGLVCRMFSLSQTLGASRGAGAGVLPSIPQEVAPFTTALFASGERLFRYAHLLERFRDEPAHAWTEGVSGEVLVLVGDADRMSLPASSEEIARRLRGATVKRIAAGDHYMHYLLPEARQAVVDFLSPVLPSRETSAPRSQPESRP
jgi:pimeloyl-ACP methyl ester carboxylesterase